MALREKWQSPVVEVATTASATRTPEPVRAGAGGAHGALLGLQRTHCNQFVQRLVQTMAQPSPPAPAASAGGRLPEPVQTQMGQAFGADFSTVQLHTDSAAAGQIGARAFARGEEVHFAPGNFRPDTLDGRSMIGHELAHVVQQRRGGVRSTGQAFGVEINDQPELEQDASRLGAAAARGETAEVGGSGSAGGGGAVLQGDFAVSLNVEQHARTTGGGTPYMITAVRIGERPQGLLKSKEGAHTSAWGLMCDQVRNNILGLTVDEAATRMVELATDLQRLPGWARLGDLTGDSSTRAIGAQASLNLATGAVPFAGGTAETQKADSLQELIKCYLQMRNLIPLSVSDTRAPGAGEAGRLDLLAEVNDGRKALDVAEVREAMWGLIDPNAVKTIAASADQTKQPGIRLGEAANLRAEAVLAQHLLTLRNAYETAFTGADMGSEASIADFIEKKLPPAWSDRPTNTMAKAVRATVTGAGMRAFAANQHREDTAGPGGQNWFAVQVKQFMGLITDVLIGARPHGLLGAREGSHVTAWVAIRDSIVNRLKNQTLAQAIALLPTIRNDMLAMPGAGRAGYLSGPQQAILTAARTDMNTAVGRLAGVIPEERKLPLIQQAIAAILAYRNSLPLAATDQGLANNKNEQGHRKVLVALMTKPDLTAADKTKARAAFWGMLDTTAMEAYYDNPTAREDQPGVRVRADGHGGVVLVRHEARVVADIVRQHLLTMEQAYGTLAARSGLGNEASLKKFLYTASNYDEDKDADFGLEPDVYMEVGRLLLGREPKNPMKRDKK